MLEIDFWWNRKSLALGRILKGQKLEELTMVVHDL